VLARVVAEAEAAVLARVVVETTVLARVVVVEAAVLVASTSLTDGWPLVLVVAELPVLSYQEVSMVLLGFDQVDQKTPERAPAG
jgi:hypothetical protein